MKTMRQIDLSWDGLSSRRKEGSQQDTVDVYFLQGLAVVGAPAAVPIAASGLLFGSGLIGLGSWSWWKRRGQPALGVA